MVVRRLEDFLDKEPAESAVIARLDRLAGELSSSLIRLPVSAIDDSIDDTLRQIADATGADRSVLLEFSADATKLESRHFWAGSDALPLMVKLDVAEFPWWTSRLVRGETVVLHRLPDDLPDEAAAEREYVSRLGLVSAVTVPVAVAARHVCALSISSVRRRRLWTPLIVDGLRFIAEILGAALHRRRQDHVLQQSRAEIARLNRQLESENIYLKEQIQDLHGFDEITGDSPALRDALTQIREVAGTDSTVLLLGETGTGKELFARAVHDRSPRRHAPLVRVNCAALPATLIESELFGHERGAYTGAVTMRQGRFELADRGTIFLDEIGDLPVEVQAKLLRILQVGEFERLGSSHTRKVDVRLVAATHRDLEAAVREGRFRPDLYYRLNVFPIRIPPLRERIDDVPRLVWFFIHQRKRGLHRQIKKVPAAAMSALQTYDWPGNVRELENVIERAMIRSAGDTLVLDEGLGIKAWHADAVVGDTLEAVERQHIEGVLRKCGWRINGAGNTAEQLGLHPNTLRFRLKKLGITRPARTASARSPGAR